MKTIINLFAATLLLASAASALADVRYVDVNSTNATPPYSSWATAATNIQDAVDAAVAGDEIMVTNGIYAIGGRAVYGTMTNRVAVDKPLTLRSVNGPEFTTIQGRQVPGTINGDGAIRCVYLTNGASLYGFTLTNGATRTGGDYLSENSGGGLWCESTNAVVVSNCVVAGNSAPYGGGAYQGTLNDCTLSGNSGGGAFSSTLNNCTVTGNSAAGGGGASRGTLNNCTLSGNSADYGGGAISSTLNNCTLTGNSAAGGYYHYGGGGAYECTLNNCTVSGNSAPYLGGGAFYSTLNNCTLIGNYAGNSGGGAHGGTLNNCIVHFNTAQQGPNYANCILSYCCTTPLPTEGVGNISSDPQLASASHLSAGSPCRAAGNAAYTTGTDIDGEPWANPPSIGCDEFLTGSVTGLLTVAISANYTYLGPGIPVDFIGQISGRASASRWEFDDGTVLSNRPYASHTWTNTGDYAVVLRAYNESNPDGASATVTIHVVDHPTHYVAMASSNPVAPYTSWATAATNIQDAVDAAVPGAEIVVTNGLYASGGRAVYGTMTNRVAVDKPLTLRSVNGPQFTTIQGKKAPGGGDGYGNGQSAIRCVYLTNGASLSGFTLTNGATQFAYDDPPYRQTGGGGLWCESTNAVIANCVVAGNQAYRSYIAGAYQGTLNNSTVSGNSGTGASSSTLNNCTLTANFGNGAYSSTLNNCTLNGNSGDGASDCTLNNCALSGNSGSGAYYSTLNNCTVTGNSQGGARDSTLNNCTLTGNSRWGAYSSSLVNCTVTGNSNGAMAGTLKNCILYFNQGANYDSSSTLNFCCATPQPTNGVGNISLDPQLASASHLSAGSPCRSAGNAAYTTGTDIDGEAWGSAPSIGCDEYHAGAVTGPLSVAIAASTYVKVGSLVELTASIQGRTTDSVWAFGDGFVEINQPFASHAWTAVGDYLVALWSFNESHPEGINAALTVHVRTPADHNYVAADSANPVPPYTSWATAATNIQDAVDWAAPGALVEVTNGLYAAGWQGSNRVAVDKPLTLRSINGPQFTTIDGGGSNRCVYLTNGASLSGFTLTHGFTHSGGGGASGGTLNNCTLSDNWAWGESHHYFLPYEGWYTGVSYGGGASGCTLNNCTLTGNQAAHGGGAYDCTLINCSLTTNTAYGYGEYFRFNQRSYFSIGGSGGGANACTLINCTLSGNSALGFFDYYGVSGGSYVDLASGGGAAFCTLKNCTLTGNSADVVGGGVAACSVNNCIVCFNTARGAYYTYAVAGSDNYDLYYDSFYLGGYYSYSTLNYCWTSDPLFVNWAAGNLRLQSNSPCINGGNNTYAVGSPDLDGNPRIAGGTVDIGAYEFQSPASMISYAWLQQFSLPIDPATDTADPDGDTLNNWQEWRCRTDPTNALSVLRMLTPVATGSDVTLRWQSVAGLNYFLERGTNLAASPAFTPLAANLAGQADTTTYMDTNAVGSGPLFYRVGVGD